MNLGENIYRLRTGKNMSQGDLADALDVSRQSVSKWENNSAIPELDKLIKMSALFGVTLDELVGRQTHSDEEKRSAEQAPQPVQQVVIQHQFRHFSIRQIIGAILLCFGFLFLPFAISATSYKPTVIYLILFAAFILCGISTICFRYPYIPCGWILLASFVTYLFLLHHWENAYFPLAFIAFYLAVMILWTVHAHISGTIAVPPWLWWLGGIVLALLLILFCINFIPPFWIGSTSHPATPN